MTSMERLIETGSYSSKEDLKRVLVALKERIRVSKRKIGNDFFNQEMVMEDIHKATIYKEEFKKLLEEL